ncbi:hypothetical protein [Thermococcus sp. JdF3]|uniref:hypothetical protein n=1 Tax=Thermococcus sp. JdF3 TaxID=1638258 RepID=UPI001438EBFF|nr:hypothetical protein [Thermococcus sp. JdF3]NJE01400.1 hypothetical protein [Thermococcus sp. JdF3]
MGLGRKDVALIVFLLLPLTSFYLSNTSSVGHLFLMSSAGVFIVSVLLYFEARKKADIGLEAFLSTQFIGLVLGQVESLVGLILFVLLAAVLTAWLPDSVVEGRLAATMGTILYTISIVLLTYWVVEPKQKASRRKKLKKTKYLVSALSIPNWDPDKVLGGDCEDLRKNSAKLNNESKMQNIVPLFQAVSYHLPRLDKVFLLVSKSVINLKWERLKPVEREFIENYLMVKGVVVPESAFKAKMKAFLLKLSECTGRPILIRWHDGQRESLGTGTEVLEFEVVPAGDFDDIEECRRAIKKALGELLEREGGEITFDITSGKSLVSVAMAIEAIREECQAEYVKQGIQDVEPEESLYRVDLDVYSVRDLLNEVAKSLNRKL